MKNLLLTLALGVFAASVSCCGFRGPESTDVSDSVEVITPQAFDFNSSADYPTTEITVEKSNGYQKTYLVADINDTAAEYATTADKANCFFVISKREYRLYVYQAGEDTLLLAHYPVCYARNKEDKTRDGDCCTPESAPGTPFTISEIKDASTWVHDFGWGDVAAYGQYFMRLKLDGSQVPQNRSIGIHGSTNNAESVPGRDSEGCIRLRDADLVRLHELYAQVGTKVVIKPFAQGKLPFEQRAVEALGEKYKEPRGGNPLAQGVSVATEQDVKDAPQGAIPAEAPAAPASAPQPKTKPEEAPSAKQEKETTAETKPAAKAEPKAKPAAQQEKQGKEVGIDDF